MNGYQGYGGYGGYAGYGYQGFGDTQSDAADIYGQIKSGDTAGATSKLQAMDPSNRQLVCDAMGQLAYADDVALASQTGAVGYPNQTAVIGVCMAAGASMPSVPSPSPAPAPAPAPAPVQQAGIGMGGWLIIGAVGLGLVYLVAKGA